MSIINEALKKAVREKEAGFSPEDREMIRRNIEIEFQKKGPRMNWGPIFILLVLVVITVPIIAPAFSIPFKTAYLTSRLSPQTQKLNVSTQSPDSTSTAVNLEASSTRKAQFAVEESPVFGNTPMQGFSNLPSLNLSGIVYSPENSYCIINNKIVKVGDTVKGARLLSVSQNTVTLDYQGKEMSLSVSNE